MVKQVVENVLEELNTHLTLLDVGIVILNTILVFVFIFLLCVMFDFSIYFALGIFLLFFLGNLFYVFYKSKYIVVEEKFPELQEKLRTVADNINKTNPIIDSLKEDVVKGVSKVNTSAFVDYGGTAIRILLITILSVLVIIFSFLNVNFDFNFSKLSILNGKDTRLTGQELGDNNLSYLQGDVNNILGKSSVAKLGNKQLNLMLNPLDSDTDLNKINKAGKEEFNAPLYPKEIYTSYDVSYNDKISKEKQKLVKNYFDQINR